MIYMMQFLVKDDSTESTESLYRVLMYTYDGKCADFFNGLKAVNLYRNETVCGKLERYIKLLVKYNVYVEGVLERRVSNDEYLYQLVGTKIKSQFGIHHE